MPEFHDRQPGQDARKQAVPGGQIVLEDLGIERHDPYVYQNDDIVRISPNQMKQREAEKKRVAAAEG